jgi:transcriptional regulator with XRE-family HTH domain
MRRLVREQARLTRQELADALDISAVTVWRYETGRQRPSRDSGRAYCRLLYELAASAIGPVG